MITIKKGTTLLSYSEVKKLYGEHITRQIKPVTKGVHYKRATIAKYKREQIKYFRDIELKLKSTKNKRHINILKLRLEGYSLPQISIKDAEFTGNPPVSKQRLDEIIKSIRIKV